MSRASDPFRLYATRFPELAFCHVEHGLWRIVALDTKAHIGPFYASKAELLGDLTRYARDYGCEV